MSDDLTAMGVDAVVRERTAGAVEKTPVYEELERFLRGETPLKYVQRILNCMTRSLTVTAAHAAVLRASNDPELSERLQVPAARVYHTLDVGRSMGTTFLSMVYGAVSDPVVVYDLNLPFDNLGFVPRRDLVSRRNTGHIFINAGVLGNDFGKLFPGVLINKGRCKSIYTLANLVVDLGTTEAYTSSYRLAFNPAVYAPKAYVRGGERPLFCCGKGRVGAYREVAGSISPQSLVFEGRPDEYGPYERHVASSETEAAVRAYIDEVVALADTDPLALFDRYGQEPGATVAGDLHAILDVNGDAQ